jgi:hypothetical protein
VLPAQLGELPGIPRGFRTGEQALDLDGAPQRVVEPGANAQLAFPVPYFWRKRSTRPAVSTSFCLPV